MVLVRGRVIEAYTGRGIAGALVSIGGRTAITDSEGRFEISDLPAGSYEIRVTHRDYEPARVVRIFEEGEYEVSITLMPKFRVL